LPDRFNPDAGADLPIGLIGARIVRFGGTPQAADLGGGGLIVDYVPADATATMRAVFEFSELGMSLTWYGVL
jgi:hypothetical protein